MKNTNSIDTKIQAWATASRALAKARDEARAAREKASATATPSPRPVSSPLPTDAQRLAEDEARLAYIYADTKEIKAEDEERAARAVATWACDARDVESGEPLAIAADLEGLAADLHSHADETRRIHASHAAALAELEGRFREELKAVKARSLARVASAREAAEALSSQRAAKGEPPARDICDGNLAALGAAISAGPTPAPTTRRPIATEYETKELLGSLETRHRKADERKRAREEGIRAAEAEKDARRAADTRAHQAYVNSGKAERDALAAAYLARTGGSQ